MKKSIGSMFLASVLLTVLLSGCAPAPASVPPTSTPLPTNTSLPTDAPVPTNTPLPTDTPIPLLAPIAGTWTGTDEGTVGGRPSSGREVEIAILAECVIGDVCGTATSLVNNELCINDLTFIEVKDAAYIFEGAMEEGSASFCGQASTVTLQPTSDGTLLYALDTYNASGERVKKTAILNPRLPPSPTLTEPALPTPSGKFEFFDVALDQASKDTVNVSFGYQLEQGLDPNGLMIIAQASINGVSCSTGSFSTFSKPYILTEAVSGIVEGADAASISMTETGKCSFKAFTLMVVRMEGSSPVLYQQDFEIPFELEK